MNKFFTEERIGI